MNATDCPPDVSIDATHGALLLGLFASLGLLGVCSVQLFYYASHYGDDPNYLKFMVSIGYSSSTQSSFVDAERLGHSGTYAKLSMSQIQQVENILRLSEAVGCGLAFHGVYRTNIETFHTEAPHYCNDIPPTLKIVMLFNGFTYATVQVTSCD